LSSNAWLGAGNCLSQYISCAGAVYTSTVGAVYSPCAAAGREANAKLAANKLAARMAPLRATYFRVFIPIVRFPLEASIPW
jgi:hypothetical protein